MTGTFSKFIFERGQSIQRIEKMITGEDTRNFNKYFLGNKEFKSPKDLPKKYPSWIKVNENLPGYSPFQTLNIEVDEIVIDYFVSQVKDIPKCVVFEGYRPLVIQDLLRFNRFYTLKDDDITLLGKFAMSEFLLYYRCDKFQSMYYDQANKIGCIIEGIVHDYAILHDASEEVVKAIEKLGKGMKYTDDFIFRDQWIPINDLGVTPWIIYETGKYYQTLKYSRRELGLEEFQVVKCRWSKNNSK